MGLQVLLSAMHLKDESYIDSLNITTDAVVINQCDDDFENVIERKTADGREQSVTYVKTKQRGLSRSRNMAISKACADICILCDNDVEYLPDYERRILDGFKAHPDADLIVFYIKRKEKPKPNYARSKRMGYLSVLKIFSPEIAFRRDKVEDIRFDERFGAGSGRYIMGEENIFLYDCLKRGLKIFYEPVMIAKLREEESTWFKGYDRDFFISRGAGYAAMSAPFSYILILQFLFRKYGLYKDGMTMKEALFYMIKGRRELLGDKGQ
ncbi:MAG: glycosyltransferase family 2 protein [Lachnospiraceae bacterium]|nr:glycosyltransferase family 2 protein [Lachnospiraceae bacterium]